MPTYEYACRSCHEHLEVVQSFTDDPLTECPACGGPLRKVFQAVGIAFKGSGFYKNDSRASTKSGSTSSSGESSGSASSTDASSSSSASTSSADSPSSSSTPSTSAPAAAPAKTSSASPAP